jgi:hypothetical protein
MCRPVFFAVRNQEEISLVTIHHVARAYGANAGRLSTIDTTGAKNGVGVRGFYSPVEAAEKHRPY